MAAKLLVMSYGVKKTSIIKLTQYGNVKSRLNNNERMVMAIV